MSDDLPDVARVADEHGSHIEPPLDPDWDSLTKLRWHAACVRLACPDVVIRVFQHRSKSIAAGPPTYSLQVATTSVSAMPYYDAWTYLSGVERGLRAAGGAS
jgi:hypothetical protein